MLNKQGFNLWANDYDKTVQVSEENNLYPFAGYKDILDFIFNEAMQKNHSAVLDIGFGTGILASKLYEHGHYINGVDFSSEMIEIAKGKMPLANLIEWDITYGLPERLKAKNYESIISTYALHHLTDEEKKRFVQELLPLLAEGGKIYVGDISFQTRADLENCRNASINYWDEDEFYFVFEEIESALKGIAKCKFYPFSHCGGVIVISK
ncbi:class I SAM-dependent methyltransferase [Planomicrobium sp. CPCC 101079]|uniref:class I SAM-dependent methyltransferase n=1 Tax=Planomicrobium sp. CPCC 101079 TaxID=2599618 RepID=UPI0011B40366|nr:class I SAM-dependent methyltransferase [Planomicrobium sp. CPCC 101079]TWT13230.1 methyltransferase domain-containing protein [Planomicrobium sp. CPCC 101079]